jgi:hypothetical protein
MRSGISTASFEQDILRIKALTNSLTTWLRGEHCRWQGCHDRLRPRGLARDACVFVAIDFDGDRVASVHDFLYARYAMNGIDLFLLYPELRSR